MGVCYAKILISKNTINKIYARIYNNCVNV